MCIRVSLNPVKVGPPAPPPGLAATVNGEVSPPSKVTAVDEATKPIVMDSGDTWKWWNTLRGSANTEKKLNVALVVGRDPPEPHVLDRYTHEYTVCILFLTHVMKGCQVRK